MEDGRDDDEEAEEDDLEDKTNDDEVGAKVYLVLSLGAREDGTTLKSALVIIKTA